MGMPTPEGSDCPSLSPDRCGCGIGQGRALELPATQCPHAGAHGDELAVLEPGVGTAMQHNQSLVMGSHSVHTSPEALAKGVGVGQPLVAAGRL